jgi:hypothetical protein
MSKTKDPVREQILYLLRGGGAHVKFDDVVDGFSPALRGAKPKGSPHTPWQLLEHMRIALWDIVEFSRSRKHVSPEWPFGYWPPSEKPPNARAWKGSIAAIKKSLAEMEALVEDPKTDLYAKIPHGDGQNILREALLVADHNAYHLGQLMLLRRMLEKRGS